MIYYLAYGSNLNLVQMARRCPTAVAIGSTLLKDYQLVFQGVATIVPSPGSTVPVAIWKIDEACEKALDRYEGFPHLYRKEYIDVSIADTSYHAMVYIMNDAPLSMPSLQYFRTIQRGYIDLGLDRRYLQQAVSYTMEHIAEMHEEGE